MIRIFALPILVCASVLFVPRSAQAVTIDLVTIGNAPDKRYDNINIPVDSVASAYQIGKYEVTVASTPSSSMRWPAPTPNRPDQSSGTASRCIGE